MPSSAPFGRLTTALALIALTTLWGCSRAPAPAATKPARPVAHDHDHDHADDHDHDHGHDDHEHAGHDHDHDGHDHDHPETLAAGVAELRAVASRVKEHLAADARDDADDAVHGMGHLLEDLQGLVRTSDLAAEGKAAATKALDDLFECFDALDTALHAEPGKGKSPAEVHASIAERVEGAIDALHVAASKSASVAEDAAAAIIREAQKSKED